MALLALAFYLVLPTQIFSTSPLFYLLFHKTTQPTSNGRKEMRFSTGFVAAFLFAATSILSLAPTTSTSTFFVSASVMGIDLGGEFIKLTAPKNNNIDIVLNEQAHRKIYHHIGFRADERYFGEDAKNFAARFPDNMFTLLHRLVGVPFNDTKTRQWYRDDMAHKAELVETVNVNPNVTEVASSSNASTGTVSFKTGSNPTIAYTAETLMGMMFGYLRDTAEKDTKLKIRDAVVTVPSFFTARQRQALIDSAALGGVNVVALMHSTTATALQYGLQNRGFGNETVHVLIFDMGSTRTEVGVYTFSPPPAPAKSGGVKQKLSEAYGTMTTRAIVADPFLSGRVLDACLAKLLERRAVAAMKPTIQPVLSGSTLPHRKAIISLLRAANKIKETLSVNKITPATVESIAPDREFNTRVTREEFEQECKPLFDRAAALLPLALQRAGIKPEELHAAELMGGAGRIPRLLDSLSAGRGKAIDRTLNADEAAAYGAGFYASVVSGRFRVKSFLVVENIFPLDISQSFVGFSLSPSTTGAAPTLRPLFPVGSTIGQRKSISLNRTEAFDLAVYRASSPDAVLGSPAAVHDFTIHVDGIADALKTVNFYAPTPIGESTPAVPPLNHPNNSHVVFIEVKATESGLVSLVEAEVRITYAVNTTKRVKQNLTDAELEGERAIAQLEHQTAMQRRDEAKAAKLAAATATAANNATESADNATADAPATNGTAAGSNGTEVEDPTDTADARASLLAKRLAAIKTCRMVPTLTEEMSKSFVPLTKVTMSFAFPRPLATEDSDFIKSMLKVWAESDRVKRETAGAKNDLDTFLVWAKNEGMLENTELRELKFMSATEEEGVRAALAKTSEWMDDTGSYDSTTKDMYVEQLQALKSEPSVKAVLDRWEAHRKAQLATKKPAAHSAAGGGDDASYDGAYDGLPDDLPLGDDAASTDEAGSVPVKKAAKKKPSGSGKAKTGEEDSTTGSGEKKTKKSSKSSSNSGKKAKKPTKKQPNPQTPPADAGADDVIPDQGDLGGENGDRREEL